MPGPPPAFTLKQFKALIIQSKQILEEQHLKSQVSRSWSFSSTYQHGWALPAVGLQSPGLCLCSLCSHAPETLYIIWMHTTYFHLSCGREQREPCCRALLHGGIWAEAAEAAPRPCAPGHAASSSVCTRGCGQGRPAANPASTLTQCTAVGKAVNLLTASVYCSEANSMPSGLWAAKHQHISAPHQRCRKLLTTGLPVLHQAVRVSRSTHARSASSQHPQVFNIAWKNHTCQHAVPERPSTTHSCSSLRLENVLKDKQTKIPWLGKALHYSSSPINSCKLFA